MFFPRSKSNEWGTWQIIRRTEQIIWIWRPYNKFGASGVQKFFEMAHEKLFQVLFVILLNEY
jgi:hypothetical protein